MLAMVTCSHLPLWKWMGSMFWEEGGGEAGDVSSDDVEVLIDHRPWREEDEMSTIFVS